ncbi:hypothetical protein D1AOALGA4SA_9775 [Olavius algarvensis Delta 1 endosymbiont]|nr:hypothetical protein D1AOALGA4SA_9775 [Olavius algarvensis Delta 1 endosymbiont]
MSLKPYTLNPTPYALLFCRMPNTGFFNPQFAIRNRVILFPTIPL